METQNLSWNVGGCTRQSHPLLPKRVRRVIIGKSGCSKTTPLTNLILHPGWLHYDKLMVYGKSLYQTECTILKIAFELGLSKQPMLKVIQGCNEIVTQACDILTIIEEMAKGTKAKSNIECKFLKSTDNVVQLPVTRRHLQPNRHQQGYSVSAEDKGAQCKTGDHRSQLCNPQGNSQAYEWVSLRLYR